MLGFILYIKYLDDHRLLKFFSSLIFSFYFVFTSNSVFYWNICPECYGDDLCHLLTTQQIQLSYLSYFIAIIHPSLTKSVYHGTVNGSKYVVLKKKSDRNVRKRVASHKKWDYQKKFFLRHSNTPQNLIFCPGFRNITWFFNYLKISVDEKHLWLDLENSIEPILLKTLGNWPFPKYLGACGNIFAEEYKGVPLVNFVTSSYKQKIIIGAKILEIAQKATYGSPDFIFYFTDISLYNLVVDLYGNVSLIDLDNVILTDRKNYLKSVSNKVHRSEIFKNYEYAFSVTDICNHYLSDHNYYSVCMLLADSQSGLFSDIFQNKSKDHNELINLLNECKDPKMNSNRLLPGKKLEIFFQNTIKNFSDF